MLRRSEQQLINKVLRLWPVGLILVCATSFGLNILLRRAFPEPEVLVQPTTPVLYRPVERGKTLQELWSRTNVFADFGSLAAARGKVFLVGSLVPPEAKNFKGFFILALDGANGEVLWQAEKGHSIDTLYATSSALYVGAGGTGRAMAYALDTGQILWSVPLPGARSFYRLRVVDNLMYIVAYNGSFLLRADTGEVIHKPTKNLTTTTLQELEPQLRAFTSPDSVSLDYFRELVNGAIILMPNGVVKDRQTGTKLWHLWETQPDVVSNLAATKTTLYLFTQEGQLVGRDVRSGELVTWVQFELETWSTSDPSSGRYVAVDEEAGLLYVYLGNSQQLFAFKIIDYADH